MTTPDDVETTARYLAGDPLDAPRPDLDRIKRLLAHSATWQHPRPELTESIVHQITTQNGSRSAAPSAPAPSARSRGRGVIPIAAGVSIAAAAALVIGVLFTGDNASQPSVESANHLTLVGTTLAPSATATAEIMETPSGVAILLSVEGLDPAPEGSYYQAWVKGPTGLVAVGTFHLRSPATEPLELWSGVDPTNYPTLTITLEPEDNNPTSSGHLVLTSP